MFRGQRSVGVCGTLRRCCRLREFLLGSRLSFTFRQNKTLLTSSQLPTMNLQRPSLLTETYTLEWMRAAEAILSRWVPAGRIKQIEESTLTS